MSNTGGGRVARFKVALRLDGAAECTVEVKTFVDQSGRPNAVVEVRPKGRRNTYTGLLSDAAECIAMRHVKATVGGVPKAGARRL